MIFYLQFAKYFTGDQEVIKFIICSLRKTLTGFFLLYCKILTWLVWTNTNNKFVRETNNKQLKF